MSVAMFILIRRTFQQACLCSHHNGQNDDNRVPTSLLQFFLQILIFI